MSAALTVFVRLRSVCFTKGLALAVLVAGSVATLPPSVRAAELTDQAPALTAVPADASFYATWLKQRAQLDALQSTKAWQKLMTIPIVQMGLMQVQTYWQYPPTSELTAVKNWVEGEQGQELLSLLSEMTSDEILIYGDHAWADMLEMFLVMQSKMNRMQFERLRQLQETEEPAVDEEEIQAILVEALAEQKDKLQIPGLVIACRIENRDRATALLDDLEELVRQQAGQCPVPIDNKLARQADDRQDLLTLTLTGDMLPWDEIEENMDEVPVFYAALHNALFEKQAVVAVGVVEQYVVIALGESAPTLAQLPEGKRLVDTPALAKLAQHAEEQIVSLGYASEPLLHVLSSNERRIGDMAVMFQALLSLADIEESAADTIKADIDQLASELVEYLPEPGQVASVSFATDRGYEGYRYYWGEMQPHLDASQPLPLMNHLGAESLGFAVGRGKQSVQDYQHGVDWIQRIAGHVETIARSHTTGDDWEEYLAVRERVVPLLKRLDVANREMLLPALANGQGALVLDASVVSQSWCEFMSPAQQPLPLPTLAVVQGVSDAALLKQGAKEYWAVAQEGLDLAHQLNEEEIPEIVLPAPTESQASGGTIYAWDLPAEWGTSKQVAPNIGLSESVVVLSALPELSNKLLNGSKPEIDGPAAEFDRPLLSAAHLEIARCIELVSPWMDYGIQIAIEQGGEDMAPMVGMVGFIKPQVEQLLEVLQVFDSWTGVTYREEDVWVTHSELRILDLE